MKEFFFNFDGCRRRVQMSRIGTDIWVHCAGETWVVSQRPQRVEEKGASDIFSGVLAAPMPGKILKINLKSGEAVQANQVVIVMEAMKMEYTLISPQAGVLSELMCHEGQQVELNQRLAYIKVNGGE